MYEGKEFKLLFDDGSVTKLVHFKDGHAQISVKLNQRLT